VDRALRRYLIVCRDPCCCAHIGACGKPCTQLRVALWNSLVHSGRKILTTASAVKSVSRLLAAILVCYTNLFTVAAADAPSGLFDLLKRALTTDPQARQSQSQLLAARVLAAYPEPSKWDAAVYLPYAVPNDLFSHMAGTKITVDVSGLATATLTLKGAKVSGDWAEAKVELELEAGTSLNADTAGLTVSGRLLYLGFAENRDGSASAAFAVALDQPRANAIVSGKTFETPDWVGRYVAAGAMRLLEEQLRFAIPVPLEFTRNFGYTGESLLRTGEGWIKLNINAPGATLRQEVAEVAPIFVPSGLWLGVDFEEGLVAAATKPPAAAVPPSKRAPLTPAAFQAALVAYEKQAGTMPQLFVNGQYLASLVNGIGKLSLAERTATATIVNDGGNLASTSGDIYAKVYLQNHDGGGWLSVAPAATWGTEGLKITCAYEASARANLHLHVDPGPGGGVGTSVGIRGSTGSQKVTATVGLRLLQNPQEGQPGSILALKADFGNQAVAITAKTDGRFKLKLLGGWVVASVPQIGAKITLPVPHNVVPSIPLLTDAPLAVDFAESVELPPGGVLTPPEKGVPTHMLIAAGEPQMDAVGCVVPFAVSFEALSKEDASKRLAAVEAVLKAESRPKIEVGSVEVDLGGIKIGKNNEIIKAVINTVETLEKAGDDVAREADRAADNVEREVGKVGENVEREVGRGGKNVEREVGKFSKNVQREVAKVTDEAVAQAGRVAGNITNTAADATKHASKAVTRVVTDSTHAAGDAATKIGKGVKRIFGK
jgi:hypothetical protein